MYTYAPLTDADSVRLLRLKGSSDVDSPIELDVFQVSLRGSLEYEAVSYAWEGQVPTCVIRCSTEDLLVTENCEAILRQFRPDDGEERTLWIDAICINQAEDASEERNRQVSLMRAIYSGATRTLIWLGSEKRHGGPVVADHMAWLNDVVALAKCGDSKTMREKLLVLGMKSSVIGMSQIQSPIHLGSFIVSIPLATADQGFPRPQEPTPLVLAALGGSGTCAVEVCDFLLWLV